MNNHRAQQQELRGVIADKSRQIQTLKWANTGRPMKGEGKTQVDLKWIVPSTDAYNAVADAWDSFAEQANAASQALTDDLIERGKWYRDDSKCTHEPRTSHQGMKETQSFRGNPQVRVIWPDGSRWNGRLDVRRGPHDVVSKGKCKSFDREEIDYRRYSHNLGHDVIVLKEIE